MGWQMPEQRKAWGCRELGEDGAAIRAMGSTGGRQHGGGQCALCSFPGALCPTKHDPVSPSLNAL